MDAVQMLENSHVKVIESVDDLSEPLWDVPGVCGEWSVKDTIAHLAAYERVLIDVLKTFQGDEPTPYILQCFANFDDFNGMQVETRKYSTAQQVINDYNEAQIQTTSLLEQMPADAVQRVGTMPWYNPNRCLADLIGTLYEHTCAHCRQIIQFRQSRA
jgi:uncharacterized damage-inducible protein DinB